MKVSIDEVIDGLASRQHGLVSRGQLLAAGLTPRMVGRRVAGKRLRPVHRGVYQAGPILPARGGAMAAVLACGPRSLVSCDSAGWLWEIRPRPAAGAPVDVTVCGRDRNRRPGIRVHRVARLAPDEATAVDGIPVTAPGRTILDLARVLDRRSLERAVALAERRELVTRKRLASLLARHHGRPGVAWLATLIRDHGGASLTRSEAESRFLELVRSVGLPRPQTNARVARYEVDFLWASAGLAVEVDGFAFHSSRRQFESDHRRDSRLAAAGIHVIRFTWRQIVDTPARSMVELAQALEKKRPHEPLRHTSRA